MLYITGTYGATTGLANSTDCADCTIGKYCETSGLTAPTGDCAAGYYCVQGKTPPTVVTAFSRPKKNKHLLK